MKLKEFTPANTQSTRAGVPAVSINQKSGLMTFNAQACEKLELKDGDNVIFHQDEEEAENWYVEKVSEDGWPLREKSNMKGLMFGNTGIVRAIASSVAFTDNCGRIVIAGTPTEEKKRKFWGLLVGGLRNK